MFKRNLVVPGVLGAAVLSFVTTQIPAQQDAKPNPKAGFHRIMQDPPVYDFSDNTGFTSLFDGTLKGWDYDPDLWDIKDGAIHIAATCEKPTGTVYAITTTGEYSDFVLKYEMKGTGKINGGMQFRSYLTSKPTGLVFPPQVRPPRPAGAARPAARPACGMPPSREHEEKWNMAGPQADFQADNNYSGMFYEQSGRAVMAMPGFSMYADANGSYSMARLMDKATFDSWFHKDDWNQFTVVALGHSTSIYMNGHLITQLVDTDPAFFRPSGLIGVESESTGDLYVRNVSIKKIQ